MGNVVSDNGLICSRFGHDIDVIELAHLTDDGLCGRQTEGGQRGAARLGALPNCPMPVMVYAFGGSCDRMRTLWPTLKWYF